MLRKVGLYFLSLWLLFFFVIILTIDIPMYFGPDWVFVGFKELVLRNVIPIICTIFIVIGLFSLYDFNFTNKGSYNIPFQIVEIENLQAEPLTFLTTNIIPLLCINFSDRRYVIVFFMLLLVMGIIFVTSNLFYANPTLTLLGFRIYKVKGSFGKGIFRDNLILITKEKMDNGSYVKYIKLDEKVYYAKIN